MKRDSETLSKRAERFAGLDSGTMNASPAQSMEPTPSALDDAAMETG